MESSTGRNDITPYQEKLRALRDQLYERGVLHASIFGSVARGEATAQSDIDILIEIDRNRFSDGGFNYFGRLDNLAAFLSDELGRSVDVVVAPIRRARLAAEIERDQAHAF